MIVWRIRSFCYCKMGYGRRGWDVGAPTRLVGKTPPENNIE